MYGSHCDAKSINTMLQHSVDLLEARRRSVRLNGDVEPRRRSMRLSGEVEFSGAEKDSSSNTQSSKRPRLAWAGAPHACFCNVWYCEPRSCAAVRCWWNSKPLLRWFSNTRKMLKCIREGSDSASFTSDWASSFKLQNDFRVMSWGIKWIDSRLVTSRGKHSLSTQLPC